MGEEAVELVIEAKDDNRELFLGEAADLLFHYLVLLRAKGVALEEVEGALERATADGIETESLLLVILNTPVRNNGWLLRGMAEQGNVCFSSTAGL